MLRTGSVIYITPLCQLIEEFVGGRLYRLREIIFNMEDMAAQIIPHDQPGRMKLSEVFC